MLHRNQVAWIAVGLTLFLSACSTPNFVMTATAVPAPVATTTPTGTPTPPNEVFLSEIVKTPQPTPWATSLPNDLGITPGITTEAEVRARLGDPDAVGCIINNKANWSTDCQALGGFRKTFNYKKKNLYVDVQQGHVVLVTEFVGHQNMKAERIVAEQGIPVIVKFMSPPKITTRPPPNPWGELVYPGKGVNFSLDCQKASGQLCDGVSRDAPITWIIYFAPLDLTHWFELEKTKTPLDLDSGVEFYIRPWTGFLN